MRPQPRARRAGFTLVELMIVFTVVSIMAVAWVVPNVRNSMRQQTRTSLMADVSRVIAVSGDRYQELGRFPTMTELVPAPTPLTPNAAFSVTVLPGGQQSTISASVAGLGVSCTGVLRAVASDTTRTTCTGF